MSTLGLPIPSFIDRNQDTILSEMKARYEQLTGKVLQPAQPEMLLLNAMAYREWTVRNQIQSASLQNLVNFASGNMLDFLGDIVGVERLAPASARSTFRFSFVDGHSNITIPAGTRIQSADGKVIFATISDASALAEDTYIDIEAECTKSGIIGNDYLIGDVNVQLDPYAYVSLASNNTQTAGGSDAETDEEFRERIKLAPDSFSVAGPKLAYLFFAKSANANIIDVAIGSITAGTVDVYPLMEDGEETPQEIIDAVEAILDSDKTRPICDTVNVESPTRIEYALEVELTVYPDAVHQDTIDMVTAALDTYVLQKRQKLGRDIIGDQVKALCIIKDVVYKADLIGFSDIIVATNEFAFCTEILVSVIGTNEG